MSEDLIRRSDAIKAVRYTMLGALNTEERISLIMDIPTIEPKRGEWIEVCKRTEQYDREGVKTWAVIYQCPTCGFVLNAIENHTAQYNFCPNCGADMKGADDEKGY